MILLFLLLPILGYFAGYFLNFMTLMIMALVIGACVFSELLYTYLNNFHSDDVAQESIIMYSLFFIPAWISYGISMEVLSTNFFKIFLR